MDRSTVGASSPETHSYGGDDYDHDEHGHGHVTTVMIWQKILVLKIHFRCVG